MKTFKEIYKEADNTLQGIAAAPGIIIGRAYLFIKEKLEITDGGISDINEALKSLDEALAKSKKELKKILSIAKDRMGDERTAIFDAQMMILDDPVLLKQIKKRITDEKKSPEFVVDDEISKYQNMMRLSNEAYMRERAHDIEDIKNRIVRNLQKKRWQSKIKEGVIVVSDTITPADTILFTRRNVKGFVTDHGGITSHAAILSRSLNIPAVVGTHNSTLHIEDDQLIIVDGFHGYVIVEPTEEQLEFFKTKHDRLVELRKGLEELKEQPAKTTDGQEIDLLANVDVTGEIDLVMTSGAHGIGLYRTEQVLEDLSDFPTEEDQIVIYNKLSSRIYPKVLTIRAFDIGGDKFRLFDYQEPNPFLGLRGIRLLLQNSSLFRTQVRAVLRASVNRNIQFMLPMVSTINEILVAKKMIEECKQELREEKLSFDNDLKVGIMVEVPSAAVMTTEFAHEVDFLSIGTNDLIQYLMAVDRGNDLVSDLYQEFSPVVIRTIHHIVAEAKKAHKFVSLCGEMAADTLAIPLLVGLGLKSLSLSPTTIPYAKRIIRSISFKKAKKLANDCLSYSTEQEIIARIEEFFKENNITRTRNII